ncbi:MAG: fibronectin type III domain-containing protein, partial [Spirochaetes bacterium]|nr:fibronectin type III domain-containing protein [Spirochaetota bacterium]
MQKLERYKKRAAALLLASVVSAGFVAGVSGCRTPAAVPQHISVWAPAQVGHYRNLSLTPGGTVHEMRFTWQSLSPTGSIRLYHAGAGNPVQTISSQTQSLDTRVADTVFFPGEGGLYTVHHVTLTGLRPGAAYEYVVVGEGFTSARKPFRSGTAGSSFSFFLGGDPQIGMGDQVGGVGMVGISEQGALFSAELDRGGWLNTMETALAHTPDAAFFLALGDQIHTRNHNELNPHAWAQSQFMHDIMFAPVQFHSLPIVPVVGNHDGSGSNNVNHQLWHSHYNTPFDAPNIRRH